MQQNMRTSCPTEITSATFSTKESCAWNSHSEPGTWSRQVQRANIPCMPADLVMVQRNMACA